jgi:hypothetical protein
VAADVHRVLAGPGRASRRCRHRRYPGYRRLLRLARHPPGNRFSPATFVATARGETAVRGTRVQCRRRRATRSRTCCWRHGADRRSPEASPAAASGAGEPGCCGGSDTYRRPWSVSRRPCGLARNERMRSNRATARLPPVGQNGSLVAFPREMPDMHGSGVGEQVHPSPLLSSAIPAGHTGAPAMGRGWEQEVEGIR